MQEYVGKRLTKQKNSVLCYLKIFVFSNHGQMARRLTMATIINRSYRIRTSSERFVARAIGHESPIALALVAFLIVFGIPFALMGVGAAYGAEADGTDIWGVCTDSGFDPDTPECAGYSMGFRKASAIAEEARKEAELEREKEALESLIRQQENADFGLRADALLLEMLRSRLETALAALPQNDFTEVSCQELFSAVDRISEELRDITERRVLISQRIAAFRQQLAELH
jgi:hypothetical protein